MSFAEHRYRPNWPERLRPPLWGVDERMPNKDPLPTTQAFLDERERVPEELREEFDRLVEMYRYHAFIHYSRPFVSYRILADLILDGWRLQS